jgi:rhamnose utilization protein RhaD (predicted bifunctional aldolase and dehydrogenase)
MKTSLPVLDIEINEICSKMGCDPLLVQGAGGNVSWKDSGVMWVKASGTCLAEARKKNIFVPVDLDSMREAFLQGNYAYKPQVLGDFSLRPSIETLLHGLMRHKVVIHLHLISALRHLIKKDARGVIAKLVDGEFSWGYVDYCKPGAELAKAVSTLLKSHELLDVIFLGNHGVVIGADTVEKADELVQLLDQLMGRDSLAVDAPINIDEIVPREPMTGFKWCPNPLLHLLAQNSRNLEMVHNSWALFPDHVVFLGAKPLIIDDLTTLIDMNSSQLAEVAFVFVRNLGVLQNDLATQAQIEQLICYYHVISNLDVESPVICLLPQEIGDLLNWDAEVYRQSMVK